MRELPQGDNRNKLKIGRCVCPILTLERKNMNRHSSIGPLGLSKFPDHPIEMRHGT